MARRAVGCQRRGRARPGRRRGRAIGRRRELGDVLDARREWLTRWIQGTPPDVCVPRVLAWRHSRRRHRLAPKDRDRSSARPSGSRPSLLEPLADRVTLPTPVRMSDGTRRRWRASTGLSTNSGRRRGFVDKSARSSSAPGRGWPAGRPVPRASSSSSASARSRLAATTLGADRTSVRAGPARTSSRSRGRWRPRGRHPSTGPGRGRWAVRGPVPVMRSWPAIR